jgi:hypothetical protein
VISCRQSSAFSAQSVTGCEDALRLRVGVDDISAAIDHKHTDAQAIQHVGESVCLSVQFIVVGYRQISTGARRGGCMWDDLQHDRQLRSLVSVDRTYDHR